MASYQLFVPVRLTYAVSVGAHAVTQRATYTVPGGHRAEIQDMNINMGAAAATGYNAIHTYVNIGANTYWYFSNTGAAAFYWFDIGGPIDLSPGDVLTIFTDNVGATVCDYHGGVLIREYQ